MYPGATSSSLLGRSPAAGSATSGSTPSRVGRAGRRPVCARQVVNAAVVAATTAAPSSQPPTTSLVQCTPSATRLSPVTTASSDRRDPQRPAPRPPSGRTAGSTSSSTPAARVAFSACPDGNE